MERRFWSESLIVKDYFWEQMEKNRTEPDMLFELTLSSSRELFLVIIRPPLWATRRAKHLDSPQVGCKDEGGQGGNMLV